MQKWILALRIVAATVLDALQVQTIRISTAHAQSVTLEDYATRTSTNVSFRLLRAGTVRLAKTLTGLINAFALKDMKEKIVLSIQTIALLFPVRTEELVSTVSETILACVTRALKENIVKRILMNVSLSRVRTEPHVINTSTRIHVLVA